MKVKKYLSCTNIAWNCSVFIILIAIVLLPLISAAEESKELVMDDPPTERDAAKVKVTIFFATNRMQSGGESAANTFSGERGEPHYGYCRVEFSPIPVINQFGSKVPF